MRAEAPVTSAADPTGSVLVLLADGKAGLQDILVGRQAEIQEMTAFLERLPADPNPDSQYGRVYSRREHRMREADALMRVAALLQQLGELLPLMSAPAGSGDRGKMMALQDENARLQAALAEAQRVATEWAQRATAAEHTRGSMQAQLVMVSSELEKLQRENTELASARGRGPAASPEVPVTADGEDVSFSDGAEPPGPPGLVPSGAAAWPGSIAGQPAPVPAPLSFANRAGSTTTASGIPLVTGTFVAAPEVPYLRTIAPQQVAQRANLGISMSPESVIAAAVVREHFLARREVVPPFPSLAMQIVEMQSVVGMGTNELVQAISTDNQVTNDVLRVINSGAFEGVPELKNLRAAVVKLGMREVANLAVALGVVPIFVPAGRTVQPQLAVARRTLLQDSITVATATSSLASTFRQPPAVAFLAALLHDVGKPFVIRTVASLLANGRLTTPPTPEAIPWLLEEAHVPMGQAVAETWDLPESVKTVLANQHTAEPPGDGAAILTHLVRVVSGLHQALTNPLYRPGLEDEVDLSMQYLGMTPAQARLAVTQLATSARRAEALVKTCVGA